MGNFQQIYLRSL